MAALQETIMDIKKVLIALLFVLVLLGLASQVFPNIDKFFCQFITPLQKIPGAKELIFKVFQGCERFA